mgnify:FL=1
MSEVEYHLKFPIQDIIFNNKTLTFSIDAVRSRLGSVLYFKLHLFDKNQNEIYKYTSPRWYIDTVYTRRAITFDIDERMLDLAYFNQIELITIGTTSENPLYFTGCMLNEGEDEGVYHTPNEERKVDISLANNRYANLYKKDGNYLQVIRPTGEKINTHILYKSACTVLAPHFADESDIDEPVNIFLEFLHQREQRIDVLR